MKHNKNEKHVGCNKADVFSYCSEKEMFINEEDSVQAE